MILSIYEDLFCDVGQEIHEYINTERDVDAIVFAIEKAHNEHPADFQSLVECLRTKERLRGTKKTQRLRKRQFSLVWNCLGRTMLSDSFSKLRNFRYLCSYQR